MPTGPSQILTRGDVIRDTYEVERMLGEGAFAQVYRVKHRYMGRQAMKVFKQAGTTQADIEREIEEARILSSLRHPNIIEVYDANVLETNRGKFGYFTMTNMPGGTLERHWRAFGSDFMPVSEAVDIMTQASRGLAVAHSSEPPIIHRDIKPQNILIGFQGDGFRVRISDFGLAKAVNPLTLLASSKGTVGFKPPEALDDVDSRAADVWAIGATLYLLLTDQMPFPALDDRDLGDAARFHRPIRPPSQYNAEVDGALESVLYRCLAAAPEDRYQDATALLTDLERWSPGRQPRMDSVSRGQSSSKVALDPASPHDFREEARRALNEALKVAQNPNELTLAADLLEEAVSKDPALRERYESQLRQWRKGIMPVSTASFRSPRRAPPKKPG